MANNTGQGILSAGDRKYVVNALISAETVFGIAVQINWTIVTFAVALQPETILGRFFVEVSRLHTDTSGKIPLNERSARRRSHYLYNTYQTQETNISTLTGTGTCNASNRAAPVTSLRPLRHRDHSIEKLKIKDPKSMHREFFFDRSSYISSTLHNQTVYEYIVKRFVRFFYSTKKKSTG